MRAGGGVGLVRKGPVEDRRASVTVGTLYATAPLTGLRVVAT